MTHPDQTAGSLLDVVRPVLPFAGSPAWPCPGADRERDRLVLLPGDEAQSDDGPTWALAPVDDPTEMAPEDDDVWPIHVSLAEAIWMHHLADWLLSRGWQAQVKLSKGSPRWRLVDCLSIAEGGGDRLDAEYPCGESQLEVLVRGVVIVANHTR